MTGRTVSAQPFISVVMPAYNAAAHVAQAIDSILGQSYPHFEFIIVDDGSNDTTADIVQEYARRDARIRPILAPHGGRSRAANLATEAARGELIARMDADDIALPQRLAAQVDWMRRSGVEVCGSSVVRFGVQNGLTWYPETHQAVAHELLFRLGLLQPTVMLYTDIARRHPYAEEAAFEDYEMWTRLAPRFRLGNVPLVLLRHRCHPRQSHVLESAEFFADVLTYSQRLFFELFPGAGAEDVAAILDITSRRPSPTPERLLLAGKWLVRLAQTPDAILRQRMAERWRSACQRCAAAMGLRSFHIYRLIAPRFRAVSRRLDPFKLWLECALRLTPQTRLYTKLSALHRWLRAGGMPV